MPPQPEINEPMRVNRSKTHTKQYKDESAPQFRDGLLQRDLDFRPPEVVMFCFVVFLVQGSRGMKAKPCSRLSDGMRGSSSPLVHGTFILGQDGRITSLLQVSTRRAHGGRVLGT